MSSLGQHSNHWRATTILRAFRCRLTLLDRKWVARQSVDIVTIMSLIVVLTHVLSSQRAHILTKGGVGVLFTILFTAGLVLKPVRSSVIPWAIMSIVMLYRYVLNGMNAWILNHYYLYTYWVTAIALTFGFGRSAPERSMRTNSGLIIGLCFLIATIWKLLVPEFPSGEFFHYMLLSHEQYFAGVSEIVGNLKPEMLKANREAIESIRVIATSENSTVITDTPRMGLIAKSLAIWTVLIEGLVGASFLTPDRFKFHRYRHWFLITFILTTYPIATVKGFALLLTTMAFANCRRSESLPRLIYLTTFICVPIFQLQWSLVILAVMNRLGLGA
jgi:hypothetical protein